MADTLRYFSFDLIFFSSSFSLRFGSIKRKTQPTCHIWIFINDIWFCAFYDEIKLRRIDFETHGPWFGCELVASTSLLGPQRKSCRKIMKQKKVKRHRKRSIYRKYVCHGNTELCAQTHN